MAHNPADALRAAGIVSGPLSPELEQFYSTLSTHETDVLISVATRINALLPDVAAHSQDDGFEAAMSCDCGSWSGAGGADVG